MNQQTTFYKELYIQIKSKFEEIKSHNIKDDALILIVLFISNNDLILLNYIQERYPVHITMMGTNPHNPEIKIVIELIEQ